MVGRRLTASLPFLASLGIGQLLLAMPDLVSCSTDDLGGTEKFRVDYKPPLCPSEFVGVFTTDFRVLSTKITFLSNEQ